MDPFYMLLQFVLLVSGIITLATLVVKDLVVDTLNVILQLAHNDCGKLAQFTFELPSLFMDSIHVIPEV